MSTLSTPQQFLDLIVQSGLLTPDQLRPYNRPSGSGPDAVRGLADQLIKDRLLTQFQTRQLLSGKIRGYFLADKYKVLLHLATGSLGPVVLCEHLQLQRLVAVKLLPRVPSDAGTGHLDALERFVRETRMAGSLDHPNLVAFQDVERNGTTPFLVADYVDGNSLQDVVATSGPLPVARAAHYVWQAALGLHHAHGKFLIHGNVKPGHVLLDRAGVVKVIDVGLAQFLRNPIHNGSPPDDDPATAAAVDYVSPEQASEGSTIDHRTDVYSLGATLYYLLTGQAPFAKESFSGKLIGHQFREPASLRELRPDVPVALVDAIARMMGKHPNTREQNLKNVAIALDPWVRDQIAPPALNEMPAIRPSTFRLGLVSGPGQTTSGSSTWGAIPDSRWGLSGVHDTRGAAATPVMERSATYSTETAPPPRTQPPPRQSEPYPTPTSLPAYRPEGSTPLPPSAMQRAEVPQAPAPSPSLSRPEIVVPAPEPPSKARPEATTEPASPPATTPAKAEPKKRKDRKDQRALYNLLARVGIVSLTLTLSAAAVWRATTTPPIPETTAKGQRPLGANQLPNYPSGDTKPQPQPQNTPPVEPKPVPPKGEPVIPTGLVITGSGSTFIKPAMERWAELYKDRTKVEIKYNPIGSGRGVENMIDKVLDFGCTDAYVLDVQLNKAKALYGEVVHVPLAMGAVVVTYNLPDVKAQLRFTGPVLADIYLGKIKKWNHEAIAASNPGANLPDTEITVIRRSDNSGTTFIWTDYLRKVSVDWEREVGVGNLVKWPVGVDAEKSDGVAKAVSRTTGAIGYVELSFALERNLKFAQVKNLAERFVQPSLESVTAAAAASLQTVPADLRYTLTDPPGEDSYPIAGTTWVVVYLSQSGPKGKELVKFLRWAVHDGQEHLKPLRYAPLPPRLVTLVDKKLDSILAGE